MKEELKYIGVFVAFIVIAALIINTINYIGCRLSKCTPGETAQCSTKCKFFGYDEWINEKESALSIGG